MAYKRIISLIMIVCLSLSITACGTLDMMVGLKQENNPDTTDFANLTDFEIVEDTIGEEIVEEPVIETVTVDPEQAKVTDILAYFEDENGFVVPVNTKIDWEEGIAKATLRSMVAGSETEKKLAGSGLHGVLPEGTEIRGMAIKDGLCRVDFTKNILNTSSYEQEENMISAITYTLTEFPTIDKVELLVEGQVLASLSKGYAINTAFERGNINLHGSRDGVNFTVYYKAPDTEVMGHYVPITFSASSLNNPVKNVLEKLFSGAPEETVLSNNIPVGINLRGVDIVSDTAVVNLGVGAVNLSEEEYRDMNAIVVLCLEQYGISDVEFNIEGVSFEEAGLHFDDGVMPAFNQY
ncbi:GerMN domain-containing protein [Sedimentibacter hydroxybenzoicus DSM 7310]|uniref:GerMN domain-containing protein n=1 Tax=Sedimentibacter hydroxybenzoicus DSM 7310 TaxID=1123245 RepID=A0A974GX09_SEDHY|nr:GerMN domain-containing protein [Sedimentibacter hydroxybenzoicus]NYB74796.1 GerMN domain-containing protein [Sedimentibacter hydroxybenzoicus DSM 7310]